MVEKLLYPRAQWSINNNGTLYLIATDSNKLPIYTRVGKTIKVNKYVKQFKETKRTPAVSAFWIDVFRPLKGVIYGDDEPLPVATVLLGERMFCDFSDHKEFPLPLYSRWIPNNDLNPLYAQAAKANRIGTSGQWLKKWFSMDDEDKEVDRSLLTEMQDADEGDEEEINEANVARYEQANEYFDQEGDLDGTAFNLGSSSSSAAPPPTMTTTARLPQRLPGSGPQTGSGKLLFVYCCKVFV